MSRARRTPPPIALFDGLSDTDAEGEDVGHNDAGRVELNGDGRNEIAFFLILATLENGSTRVETTELAR